MRTGALISVTILITSIALLIFPKSSIAQGEVTTANPASINIELSANEPAPPGLLKELTFGSQGGGGALIRRFSEETTYVRPTWADLPIYGASGFVACGYTQKSAPVATLQLPSGTKKKLTLVPTNQEGCWYQQPDSSTKFGKYYVGMEFGLYKLDLTHPQGELSYSWAVGYPLRETVIPSVIQSDTKTQALWLMGFSAGQMANLDFYSVTTDQQGNNKISYLARRTVQVDKNGTLLLNLNVGRSAPFQAADVELGLISNADNKYFYVHAPYYLGKYPTSPIILPVRDSVSSKYDIYKTFARDFKGDGSACMGDFSNPGLNPIYQDDNYNDGTYAQVNTPDQKPLAVYANFDDLSKSNGEIPNGDPVEVLDSRSTITDNKPVIWHRVRTEDGMEGWANNAMLVTAVPDLPKPGMQANILPVASQDSNLKSIRQDVYFQDQPDKNARKLGIATGKHVSIMAQHKGNMAIYGLDNWFFVRADSGEQGWIPEMVSDSPDSNQVFWTTLHTLPWKPVSLDGFALPTAAPTNTPAPVPTTYKACPNSLPTQLYVGIKGIVLPGTPNNLRDSPDGKILGVLDENEQFSVLDGPKCSRKGLTFWKVQSGNKTGWTAEADATAYYVGPNR